MLWTFVALCAAAAPTAVTASAAARQDVSLERALDLAQEHDARHEMLDLDEQIALIQVGRAVGDVANEAREKLATLSAPEGVFVAFTGEAEKADELADALWFGGLFALMLVFMVMAETGMPA